MNGSNADWPFDDPPNTAVITNVRILDGLDWIKYVTLDEEDGVWQFLPSQGHATMKEAAVVGLEHIVSLDPTLTELSNLPPGWYAQREAVGAHWTRAPGGPDNKVT